VLSIIGRQSAAVAGREFDAESDEAMRLMVTNQIESQSGSLYLSGRLYDDGVIDPRDTRTVLGICLSAIHSGPVQGANDFGVFRF
jgi:acyl-CoA carboxylase subunit beta